MLPEEKARILKNIKGSDGAARNDRATRLIQIFEGYMLMVENTNLFDAVTEAGMEKLNTILQFRLDNKDLVMEMENEDTGNSIEDQENKGHEAYFDKQNQISVYERVPVSLRQIFGRLRDASKIDLMGNHQLMDAKTVTNILQEFFAKEDMSSSVAVYRVLWSHREEYPWINDLLQMIYGESILKVKDPASIPWKDQRQDYVESLLKRTPKPMQSGEKLLTQLFVYFRTDQIGYNFVEDGEVKAAENVLGRNRILRAINHNLVFSKNSIFTTRGNIRKSLIDSLKQKVHNPEMLTSEELVDLLESLGFGFEDKERFSERLEIDNTLRGLIKYHLKRLPEFSNATKFDDYLNPSNKKILSEHLSIIEFIEEFLEKGLNNPNQVYDRGTRTTYYTNILPSFMSSLFSKLNNPSKRSGVLNFYKDSFYFYNEREKTFRNIWLRKINGVAPDAYPIKYINNTSYNGVPYEKLTRSDYITNCMIQFLSPWMSGKSLYYIPIMSDSNNCEFVEFQTFYRGEIMDGLYEVAKQEILRMEFIKNNPDLDIAYFNERGSRFQFMPFLNKLLKNENSLKELASEEGRKMLKEAIAEGMKAEFEIFKRNVWESLTEERRSNILTEARKKSFDKRI